MNARTGLGVGTGDMVSPERCPQAMYRTESWTTCTYPPATEHDPLAPRLWLPGAP